MNSIFNQLLNVKGVVVETVRIVDSPCAPSPCSRFACARARAYSDAPAVANVVMVTTKVAACVVGGIRISAAGGSNWSP